MRLIQLSSGRGPAECELAVGLYLKEFMRMYPEAVIVESMHGSAAECGRLVRDCYRSVLLELPESADVQLGTVKWICESPFRKHHKRKNWFIELAEVRRGGAEHNIELALSDKSLIRFETFKSGGRGGQNVNKVDTGARVIHLPTGISSESTTARTQHQNKKLALDRLIAILASQNRANETLLEQNKWLEHERLERGNAFATYSGMEFIKVE